MDIAAYFARIGYSGDAQATTQTLRAITLAHATSIPFENISVLVSGPPDLAIDALEAKLVRQRRGGYCYEQNSLLMAALRALGFDVVPLSARVRFNVPAETMTPRSHMVLCVRASGERYLVDAGFGRLTPTAPLRLDTSEAQRTPHEDFRLQPHEHGTVLQALVEDAWRDVYTFDLVPQLPIDYVQQNWHTATRPGALFANNLTVSLPSTDGRRTLLNRTLTWRGRDGAQERTILDSREALGAALASRFGLSITRDELARAWDSSGGSGPHTAVFE